MWNIQCEHLYGITTKDEEIYCCTKRKLILSSSQQCKACQKCDRCVANKDNCNYCRDSFENAEKPHYSFFQEYIPLCPRGYTDCVCDPAYIKRYHQEWYKELYGDMTPEEALYDEDGCYQRFLQDPVEKYGCYDDEDK